MPTSSFDDTVPRPRIPRVLAVADEPAVSIAEFREWCRALAETPVDALQLRARSLPDRARLEFALAARAAFAPPRLLFVNGRFDIALLARADGVQLPADGLPVSALREAAPDLVVGRSTHSLAEIRRAAEEGADFALLGPIFPTPAKARFGPPLGVASLSAAAAIGIPLLAIGGIDDLDRAAEVRAAGAWGFAAVRFFATPDSMTSEKNDLLARLARP